MSKFLLSLGITLCFSFIFSELSNAQVMDLGSAEAFIPPRMDESQRDAITNLQDGLVIFNTSTNRLNYYDAFVTQWFELHPGQHTESPDGIEEVITQYLVTTPFGIGILLANGMTPLEIINAGADTSTFAGAEYLEGRILYCRQDGSGEVIYTGGTLGEATWGCEGIDVPGAADQSVGAGLQNTLAIDAVCTTSGIAADTALSFISPDGYADWYLPSLGTLQKIGENFDLSCAVKDILPTIGTYNIWTSNQNDAAQAQTWGYSNTSYCLAVTENSFAKSQMEGVVVVRAF